MNKYTMGYTHQQIGGFDKTDTRLYQKTGDFLLGPTYESPAYSGNFQCEVIFRADDHRLPDLSVAVIRMPKNVI